MANKFYSIGPSPLPSFSFWLLRQSHLTLYTFAAVSQTIFFASGRPFVRSFVRSSVRSFYLNPSATAKGGCALQWISLNLVASVVHSVIRLAKHDKRRSNWKSRKLIGGQSLVKVYLPISTTNLRLSSNKNIPAYLESNNRPLVEWRTSYN